MTDFVLIDRGEAHIVPTHVDGKSVRVAPADLDRTLGVELKPEGICIGPVCYPVPEGSAIVTNDGIDLASLAGLLQRPIAVDVEEAAAFVGVSAGDRTLELASLHAPDFTLPDLDGRPHSLSDYRGTKVLLAAWASW